jgi:hypothetical protein
MQVSNFHAKVAAAAFMVIDHCGLAIDSDPLRAIGRLSFPLFAWLLVQGYTHTKDLRGYRFRILFLAIVSEPLYRFFTGALFLNPVYELLLGLFLIEAIEKQKFRRIGAILLVSFFVTYSIYGLALIYLLWMFPKGIETDKLSAKANLWLWIALWVTLHACIAFIICPLQVYAVGFVLLLPLLHKISNRGPKARWFYWFYPLHFAPLLVLKNFAF